MISQGRDDLHLLLPGDGVHDLQGEGIREQLWAGGEAIKGHMVIVEQREWVKRKLALIINVVLVHRRQ